jgi:O-antigen ligase
MYPSVSVERGGAQEIRWVPIQVLFFLSPVITAAIPRITWLFLPLTALALIAAAIRKSGEWRPLLQLQPASIACLVVVAYLFLNASWAADPGTAVTKAFLLLAVLALTFAAGSAIPQTDDRQLRKAAMAFALGTFVVALFVAFELLTDGAITRLALNSIHLLQRPNFKHATISHGQITSLNISNLNQNVAILAFALWPALLVLQSVEHWRRRLVFTLVLFAAAVSPICISSHQSSQVAIGASLAIFVIAWFWRKTAIRLLAALWCLAFVLALPAAFLAYKGDLHMAPWLPDSFRARVIIWEYTAERALDHPWLGVGVDSTHVLKEPRDAAERPPGFIYQRTIGWHAHDLFLQTWFELGVVGAILIAFAGAVLVLQMSLLPAEAQPFAAANFTVFMAIEAFGWGMWQTWLICAIALSVICLLMAACVAASERPPPSGKHL